jgi:Fe-S oxidoreductase
MEEQDRWIETLEKEIKEWGIKCINCNFCYSACPLFKTMRGFLINGPSGLLQSIYYALHWDLLGKEYQEDIINILYSCTTCNSCVLRCKDVSAGIPIVDLVESGRKILLEKAIGPLAAHKQVLEFLYQTGNPYGKPAAKRLDWLKELEKENKLNYKLLPGDDQAETLLYIGCTASYEEDLQNVARSTVLLLEKVNANYGILKKENCCGSPARQLGEEGLFLDLSEKIEKAVLKSGVKQVVTVSPHCYNSFKMEYSESFKKHTIQHYTEYFFSLMEKGILSPSKQIEKTITYHDSCYLGKRNEIYDAPRAIISKIPGVKLVEMRDNRVDSLCCGGGGGRMYIDVDEVTRLSHLRLEQAISTGAEIIATACPWCYTQMKDAIKVTDQEGHIEVMDISELLLMSVS